MLLFEYEKEYLYAWLMQISFELGVPIADQKKICKDCGEGHSEVCSMHGFRYVLAHSHTATGD